MSDKHDPSDGTPHIKVTVYSTPCESEEWPSIDNFNVFQYPGRNRPSILKEYLDEARREPERMVYLSSAAAVGRSALIFPVNGTLAATIASWIQSFDFSALLAGLRDTLPLAGRITGIAALLWPTKMGNAELYQGAGPLIDLNRAKLVDMRQADMVVTLPSELVTTVKPADIRGQKRFPQWLWHRVWWMPLSRSTRLHSQWRKIRIFRSSRHKKRRNRMCIPQRLSWYEAAADKNGVTIR